MARDPLPEGKLSPPVVPPRNDPKPLEPYARSRALEIQGRDERFAYQWFSKDQLNSKLRQHEIGSVETGFLMVDAWEVVDDKQGITQGRMSDAAGRPVDTTVTNGELVLCRTTRENAAKYALIEQRRDARIDERLSHGQAHNFGYGTTFKTRTAGGRSGLDAIPTDILNEVA